MKVHCYRGVDSLRPIYAGGEPPKELFAAEVLPETGARRDEVEAGWSALLTLWAESYLAHSNEPVVEICKGTTPAEISAFAFRHAVHGSYAFPSPSDRIAQAFASFRKNELTRQKNVARARMGKAQSPLERTALDNWIEGSRKSLEAVIALASTMLVFRYSDLGISAIAVSDVETGLDQMIQTLRDAPSIDLSVVVEHRQLPTR